MKYLIIICFISFMGSTLACKGYKLRVDSVENCGGADQIITFSENSTMLMTDECEFIPISCITIKPFKTAQLRYKINKNGLPLLLGIVDMCQSMKNFKDYGKDLLDLLGFPQNCPFQEMKACYAADKKADITRFGNVLPLYRGKIAAEFQIIHDTGTSCFKFNYEVFK